MPADQDVFNQTNGIDPADPTGFEQYAFVRVRARKVLGDVVKKLPFTRSWGSVQVAATPSDLDHNIGSSEQTSWRYIDSQNQVRDLGDMELIRWEYFLLTADPKILSQAIANASVLRAWPAGFPGAPSFEVGQ